ncbi:coiled-coil domain-containing protein 180-like [Anneissia japonica]|uniref:coiled-coil domain-containing protein 180-like n=1 Tax=Anneissia japonica TaxID=1529436 RepID=UPI001425820D|nr:coiled-coil domain-containing protein 180-like [Anneissia japonica]
MLQTKVIADTHPPCKVIPSGKVYRQIFDAEVQLVNALEKAKLNSKKTIPKDDGVPLVKENRKNMCERPLNKRQMLWIESKPNDDKSENPVLYRQEILKSIEASVESEHVTAARDVRGLSDVMCAKKAGSDIIDRISESRQQRHEAAVEDLHQDLTLLAHDLEPQIAATGKELTSKMQENDEVIDQLLSKIGDDKELQNYTLQELVELWADIAKQSKFRREWIVDMDTQLNSYEDQRLQKIKGILKSYAKCLEGIAHLMPPDVDRFIEKESQIINQTVLHNRCAYSNLYARLLKADIEREKDHYRVWEGRVEDWRKLNTDVAIQAFLNYMMSDSITKPVKVEEFIQQLREEQDELNTKRLNLIHSLRQMKPPSSTKAAVYQWNKEIGVINKQIEQVHVAYLDKMHEEYEQICQDCLVEMEKHKNSLLEAGVCSEQSVTLVMEGSFLPLIGERQRIFEEMLQTMDKSLENLSVAYSSQLHHLFKYAQGAGHLWDVHEIGLAKRERQLQEMLEACRHEHDNQNQDTEANLDIIMDRMRQEATEEVLKDKLLKAMLVLDNIKSSYYKFHEQQHSIVKEYPNFVQDELQRYDQSVCKFFDVDRLHPNERKLKQNEEIAEQNKLRRQLRIAANSRIQGTPSPAENRSVQSRSGSVSVTSRDSTSSAPSTPAQLAVKEVLSSKQGTTFYVLTISEDAPQPEKDAELMDLDSLEKSPASSYMMPVMEKVIIDQELFQQVRREMRMAFIDHLEEWSVQAVERANSVVAAKIEELNSELDLRLHLHGPRSRRAELDIHNVRAAELVMHQERVSRHSRGITAALKDCKDRFVNMQHEHDKLADDFKEEIDSLESIFVNATKSSMLSVLSTQVSTKLESYMQVIRASLRQFRQYLDDTLQMLRESNARFIRSFKLFSDGGNFCPEEIDGYKKKLEKLATKIDSAEGFVMADLEGMEARRLQQASEIATKFEDRFKHHLFDLTFVEKLTRWLTNTQVKIKAEVADSNSQAQKLLHHLNTVERRIDACQRPNLDKEQITAWELMDSLPDIFNSFEERSHYLNCSEHQRPPPSATLNGNIVISGKVGFQAEPSQQAPQTHTVVTVMKAGKTQVEDSAVGLIKNILSSQRVKARLESGQDNEDQKSFPKPPGTQSSLQADEPKSKCSSRPHTKPTDKERLKVVSGRRSTATSLENNPRRSASGHQRNKNPALKFDAKYYVFGEKPEREVHFLATIRRILQESLDGLLTTADMYYRQKGLRLPTRPQAIHETFEQCADIIVTKLQLYYTQADNYHNHCLQEFREQLERAEVSSSHVPPLIISEVLKEHRGLFTGKRADLDHIFNKSLLRWKHQMDSHKTLLRPTLGHPHQATKLAELCENEAKRHEEYIDGVEKQANTLKECAYDLGADFINKLACLSEQVLLLFDKLLTVDEVHTARVEKKKLKTSTLIRRKQADMALEDTEYEPLIQRGSKVWPGVAKNLMMEGTTPDDTNFTASVTTAKTTLGHQKLITSRDNAFKEYLQDFERNLAEIAKQREEQLMVEQRWDESWQRSVMKVKDLY